MTDHADTIRRKCDAKGCGSPATVTDRIGAWFCKGHSYLASKRDA